MEKRKSYIASRLKRVLDDLANKASNLILLDSKLGEYISMLKNHKICRY